ncbi:glycosyltransferase [Bacteroides sp. KH569_7]|uniref:Glycosyltransferase n=1 Tax=Bacteroides muris (ex Fokt et al. 2023) TaxID=2937417 RepID=A0A9X2SYF2_9BACE|nr:glycosyltransferase [Bacteroides muris (ex Fokt et al. 2023)]MCR6509910.1 glycosyltransferase [Bacteroides muris (ex Fokt et al. 2023)]
MISVCIATHNGEKYIKEQVDSILSQLEPEDEIVISDDGSTDNTLAILEAYHDFRIKVYTYKHLRKYRYIFDYATHNFENALRQAKGDIIFLADQDDVWMPNKVERVMANMNDCDILFHGRKVVDSNLQVIQEFAMPHPEFWRNIKSCTTTGCCTVFKRKILDKVLPFPESGVGHDFWIGVYGGFFYKRKFLKESLMLFRRHGNNVTPSNTRSNNPILMRLRYRIIILWEIVKVCLKNAVW